MVVIFSSHLTQDNTIEKGWSVKVRLSMSKVIELLNLQRFVGGLKV